MVKFLDDIKRVIKKINPRQAGEGNGELAIQNFKKPRRFAFKAGFSLAEVLVAMLIMSVFYVATAKVMSIKQKNLIQENRHGYFECVGNAAPFQIHRVNGGHEVIPVGTQANSCEFVPVSGIPFYNVYVLRPGLGYYDHTESQINDEDNMNFNGASELISLYRLVVDDIDSKMSENMQGKFTQFRNYLQMAYPNSVLMSNWPGSQPRVDAVFIVW